MNKTASIIEINGNRYDAISGQLIGAARKAASHIKRPIDGLSVDGITKPTRIIRKSAVKRSIYALQRQVPSGAWQRKPERSKTLARGSVKKPTRPQPESKIKARGLAQNHAQVARAAATKQNSKVQRFGMISFSSRSKSGQAKTGEIMPKGVHLSAAASASIPTTLSSVGSASHHKLERLLDYALASADAHKKAGQSRRSQSRYFGRLPKWAALSLAALILACAFGLFMWHKIPVASMKLAATKAHINASLPTPISGYKIGPITSGERAVTTTIQSITDSSKKYMVTERSSNQPAASLSDTAGQDDRQVQTIQDQGKTYLLSQEGDKSTATCVKGANTIIIEGLGLNAAEQASAIKNACDD